jgi:hypothetical protein
VSSLINHADLAEIDSEYQPLGMVATDNVTHTPPPILAIGHIEHERCRADDGMGGGVADVRARRRGRVRKRVFWEDWRDDRRDGRPLLS